MRAKMSARGPRKDVIAETIRGMLDVLRVTFPFFALVLCGYWAARRQMLPFEAIPGLNGFVLYFALPCMLFRFGANTPVAQLLDAGVSLSYLFCALVMVGFLVAVSMNRRIGWNDAAFGALVGAFPNTGFMGMPLLVALLGDAASPVALFTIGAVLARSQKIAHHEHHGPLTWRDYVPVALMKLFLHPLLVLCVGLAAISIGVPIEPFALEVMVLVAALPSASNVAMLSERFGADNGRIARIILVSTAAAFLTFSGAVTLLR